MEQELNHIDILIGNYLSGESTQAENDELMEWVGQSPVNKHLFDENQRIWGEKPFVFTRFRNTFGPA